MPDEAEVGVVRFDISNTGDELHEYALGRLDEGKTLADVKTFLESGEEDPPEWFTDVGGVPLLSPGEKLGLTRELEAGTYVDTEREFFLIALEPGKKLGDIDRFFEAGEGTGEPPARFHGAMQTIPAGTSVFVAIGLEAGVEYTLTDTSGEQPVVATFTPT